MSTDREMARDHKTTPATGERALRPTTPPHKQNKKIDALPSRAHWTHLPDGVVRYVGEGGGVAVARVEVELELVGLVPSGDGVGAKQIRTWEDGERVRVGVGDGGASVSGHGVC